MIVGEDEIDTRTSSSVSVMTRYCAALFVFARSEMRLWFGLSSGAYVVSFSPIMFVVFFCVL